LRKSHAIRDPRLQHRVVSVFETPNPAPALSRLAAFLRDNALTPRRARRLPLEDAAEAHRLVEKGGLRESIALSPNLG
jgi:NADPH:quinone reductase-like Zn-dependent oxidoreductase